jgi:hypothetical protein
MKIVCNAFAFILAMMFVLSVDMAYSPFPKVVVVGEAEAIIGVPFSPVSYAGVARRTTRRAVAITSTEAASASAAAASTPAPPPAQPSAPPPPQPAAPKYSAVPTGTIVQTLPAGCTSVVVGGASYSDCGGVFYKAAFQGNNLVYVVVERPVQ